MIEICEVDLPGHPLHGKRSTNREELEQQIVADPLLVELMRDRGYFGKDDLPNFLDEVVPEMTVEEL